MRLMELAGWCSLGESMWTEYDFMRGGCYVLALWLHRRTKLPLYGVIDDHGDIGHAFVYDPATDRSYDARGVHHTLDGVKIGGQGTVRPVSVEEVRAHAAMAIKNSQQRLFPRRIPSSERSSAVTAFVNRVPALANLVKQKRSLR